MASVLGKRISGWWLRSRRRIPVSHQRLQHPRRARQLQPQLVQARRSGVQLTALVRPPGRADGPRRLARRDGGGIPRFRDEHLERRPRELRVRAAVWIGAADDSADATAVHGARRLRGVAVGPQVWRRHGAVRRRGLYTGDRCPDSARRRRTCTRRRQSASTRARRAAMRGVAASTESPGTITPTATMRLGSDRSTTR